MVACNSQGGRSRPSDRQRSARSAWDAVLRACVGPSRHHRVASARYPSSLSSQRLRQARLTSPRRARARARTRTVGASTCRVETGPGRRPATAVEPPCTLAGRRGCAVAPRSAPTCWESRPAGGGFTAARGSRAGRANGWASTARRPHTRRPVRWRSAARSASTMPTRSRSSASTSPSGPRPGVSLAPCVVPTV
jgi:hypothetical protein